MRYSVNLLWKVLTPLLADGLAAARASGGLFNRIGGRGFVRSLGGDFRLGRVPVVLAPTDMFHDTLRGTREALGLDGNRFPYEFVWARTGRRMHVNVSLHLHEDILC